MDLNLKLKVEEVNAILAALAKRPFEEVHTLVTKIKTMGEAEFAAAKAANFEPEAKENAE